MLALKMAAREIKIWKPLKDILKTKNFREFQQFNLEYEVAICALIVFRKSRPQNIDHKRAVSSAFKFLYDNN